MRQRATQCLGKEQLPGKSQSRFCSPTSRWPGQRVRWHEEQENGKLIQTSNSGVCAPFESVFRSHENVKAWLESSPNPEFEDLDDDSAWPSSFQSLGSSPAESVDHLSCSTRFGKVNPPGHARVSLIRFFS